MERTPDDRRRPPPLFASAVVSASLMDLATLYFCWTRHREWAGTVSEPDPYGPWWLRLYNGQLCYFSRTVAGATPTAYIWPVYSPWPRVVVRGMESNLAGFTFASMPFWPLVAVIGTPAWYWIGREWWRHANRSLARRRSLTRGLESTLPAPPRDGSEAARP